MHPLKEKIMVNNSSRRHQLSIYLNGQDGSYTYDWKRVVRNMEFDEEDEKRMQIRYLDVDSMITNIDHDNEKLSDKCYKMLEELERIKGGELSWPRLKPALERIDRIGCANNFEWYMHCGKPLVIKACVHYFLSNFYFSPNDSASKTMKNVFYFI